MTPREPKILLNPKWSEVDKLVIPGALHAIDIETTGLDVTDEHTRILGIGISNYRHCFYVDIREADADFLDSLWIKLAQVDLVAHNSLFDKAFLERDAGCRLNFVGCSSILFKMMATEGWAGQRHNLSTAIDDILDWPENSKATFADLLAKHRLTKSRMWELAHLEPYAFGEYCAGDAEACFQLWNYLSGLCIGRWESILVWHQQEFMNELNLLIEGTARGIEVNEFALRKYELGLGQKIEDQVRLFLRHPLVAPWVAVKDKEVLEEHLAKEPTRTTKTGKPSRNWEKWEQKREEITHISWFNVNSGAQLRWLFYDCIYPTAVVKVKGKDMLQITVEDYEHQIELLSSGERPMDKKVLPFLGEPGAILVRYNKLKKEREYVNACLSKLKDGVLHPQFKMHGTVTGRLGGDGGFNLQQQPKTRGYLQCFTARPGHKLLQLDFSAIEPVVLTNASEDPTLMKLYGPDAKPNDVYLYNAAHFSAFAEQVRQWYDPDNPTEESISLAKKHCKKIRGVSKTVHLAKQYGASAGRIFYTLRDAGFPMPFEDVEQICEEWNSLYRGTKQFETKLKREWFARKGWFYNLCVRPLSACSQKEKDLVNTFCQSSGHDILLKYLNIIQHLREERKVEMYPWILDQHDETVWEVPDHSIVAAEQIFKDALTMLNEELSCILIVPVKGDTMVCDTWADIKCE